MRLLVISVALACACAPDVSESEWGTDHKNPQSIMFEAVDAGQIVFDQDYFISEGQSAFRELCVNEVVWDHEISGSVDIREDDTVLWKHVSGNDPVIVASGYMPTPGVWDVTLKLGGGDCYSSLSVVSMGRSSGYSRTEEW